ncbi:MAG: hypothetical protein DRQ88_10925 [Epsilonproteobacteria bacterium]|nr:MAG: hypothetical protein DRQ89_11190 [Campylobacterota bacterium]RLA64414.1 MAG: hypothetical protein DRQ88_10925 [Campylobacterota bacterium]
MKTFTLLSILFSFNAHSFGHVKPFKITISGDKQDLRSVSRMADLEVAKSITHCRGAYIPFAKSRWNCSGRECTRIFGCRRITRGYSRVTLISASRRGLKNSKKIQGNYEIRWPIDKPPTFDTGKAAKKRVAYKKQVAEVKRTKRKEKQLEFVKIKEIKEKKKVILKERKPSPKILEEEALALLEEENLEDYDDILAQKPSKMYQDITIEDMVPEGKEEFKTEIQEDDTKWKLVTTMEEDGSEKTYELKKAEDGPLTFQSRLKLANFSLSYKSVSDNEDAQVGTGNISWAPQFIFHPNWGVKLDAGVQFYSITIADQTGKTIESTTFPIIPLMLYVNYLGKYYFLEAGAGMQFWLEDRLDNYMAWSLGFGYRFPTTMAFFDRVFFNYNNVLVNVEVQEFQLGFSFKI